MPADKFVADQRVREWRLKLKSSRLLLFSESRKNNQQEMWSLREQPSSNQVARIADAPGIAHMSRDLVETGFGWTWKPLRIAKCVKAKDTNVIVVEKPFALAGFSIMQFMAQEAHLLLHAVAPAERRQGLGVELLQWMERAALVAGVGVIYLETPQRNLVAQHFYEACGYSRVALAPGYYRGQENAVRMARDLWADASLNTN